MADVTPKLKVIDGIPVSISYDEDTFRSALNYKAQPNDIFLSVYPKSGTTWAQVILYTLTNKGKAFDHDMAEYLARIPSLEQIGQLGMKNMHQPYVIKSHLPFDRLPRHPQAKYVCVLRNPKDVCTSYYHFILKIIGAEADAASFDEFFETFISGNLYFGGYFEHLHAVWQHKDDPNVFITSYEQMKHYTPAVIRQLALFLNIELDDDLLERIITYSSFNYMKERYDKAYSAQAKIALANDSPDAPLPISKSNLERMDKFNLVRKGVVGDWSSAMTEEQSRRMDQIFAEKTADLDGLQKLFLLE